ncbi:hypothetical protein [Sediminimonas sp.]|uniref:hypothetical protein n=1 Tax=Sediminimonas sp. TaxID=2823379 RepID=UPI0025F2CB66|nr:hypothetical protein [Sediminimonas sp.]
MAVLEWCKLFGDRRGKHCWGEVVSCQGFEVDMLKHLDETDDQFKKYIDDMREYRNMFLAHLDDERTMNIPRMDIAEGSVKFLYDHLICVEATAGDLEGLPTDLTAYQEACGNRALSFLGRCNF